MEEQFLKHNKEDEDQYKLEVHTHVSTVPDTSPFVLVRLEHWIMHLADVVFHANLVWQLQSAVEPDASPVEYEIRDEEQFLKQDKEEEFQ